MSRIPVIVAKKTKSGLPVYGLIAVDKPNERVARVHVRRELNSPGGPELIDQTGLWLSCDPSEVSPTLQIFLPDQQKVELLPHLGPDDRAMLQSWVESEQLTKRKDGQIELTIQADTKRNMVFVDFASPIRCLHLPPESVRKLIDRLQSELTLLEKGMTPHAGDAHPPQQHDHPN